jgi:syntaxin 8
VYRTARDELDKLKSQYSDLQSQFHGFAPSSPHTLTTPNDASLAGDFDAAQQRKPSQSSRTANKSVRFRDSPQSSPDRARAALFPARYTDEPQEEERQDHSEFTNEQIHEYHTQVLREQDGQLDELGRSIGRQRELSMQIGNELDSQVLLLDDVEEGVDRHQGQLDRARTRLDRFMRKARENWSLTVIAILIVILVLLIIILK